MRPRCGTMPYFFSKLDEYPPFRESRNQLHTFTEQAKLRDKTLAPPIPRKIPVVVHILYKNGIDNLTDAQITSQINVLNEDFSAANVDISDVPGAFQRDVGNPDLQFYLAKIDPDGQPTDGITRAQTTKDYFCACLDEMKSSRLGGVDAWDTKRYLNIWVCRTEPNWAGYAMPPGGPPETDGVVIYPTNFGFKGSAEAPLHLGRTCTHEIGHYLNLEHIWGYSEIGDCTDSDYVNDTPNQYGPNYNVGTTGQRKPPTFPLINPKCPNGPNGDMFMNFMDYVDDDTMVMFSKGQVARMHATLEHSRPDLGKLPDGSPMA